MADCTVCVKPLSQQYSEEDLKKAFKEFNFSKVHINRNTQEAFV